jgi:hypothetical protein
MTNGKGDRNRSYGQGFRDGYERIFGVKKVWILWNPNGILAIAESREPIAEYLELDSVFDLDDYIRDNNIQLKQMEVL